MNNIYIKKASLLLFVIILIVTKCLNAQNLGRRIGNTIPEGYLYNIKELQEHIYNQIPSYSKDGKYGKTTLKFANLAAHSVSWNIKGGNVYYDWSNLEDYLNKILEKVVPEEMKGDTMIHAYIHKSGESNAYMTPTGHIFVSVGFLAELKNEAELAAVFTHELAHYKLQHSLKHFIKNEFGGFATGLVVKDWITNPYTKKQELEADSLGMLWLNQSGYHFLGHYNNLKFLKEKEDGYINRMEYQWEIKDIPHATSKERFNLIRSFQKKNTINFGKFFLVSENEFNRFKEECKIETLKYLLSEFNFYTCIEKAFRYHLFDPNNPTYVYYIMESIRLIGNNYDKDIWEKNFISHRYYDTTRIEGMRVKKPVKRNIFEKLEYKLIPINKLELKNVKALFYWQGDKKFTTYAEAMEFYFRVGEQIGCNECKLTYALSLKKKEDVQLMLTEYLKQDNIAYKDYAESFMEGKEKKKYNNKKLLVINDLEFYVKQGQEIVPLQANEFDSNNLERNLLDTLNKHFPKRQIILASDLRKYHLNDYKNLEQLRIKTSHLVIDKNHLYLYDKYKVDEIEFLNGEFYESKNLNNQKETYEEIIKMSYKDMLFKTKSSRFFDTWFRSVKLIKHNELSYDIHRGVDNNFKFKEPGYTRFFKKVIAVIDKKDKNVYR